MLIVVAVHVLCPRAVSSSQRTKVQRMTRVVRYRKYLATRSPKLGMPVIAAILGRDFTRLTPENVPYWLVHVLSCSQLGSQTRQGSHEDAVLFSTCRRCPVACATCRMRALICAKKVPTPALASDMFVVCLTCLHNKPVDEKENGKSSRCTCCPGA